MSPLYPSRIRRTSSPDESWRKTELDSTLKEVFPKPQPAQSSSPEQPKLPVSEEGGDSGVHSKVGAHSPTDEVDIHPSQDDLAMLGNASGGADNNLSHSS